LDLVDEERAARQAAALSYLRGLTNLIPADAARISRLLADRFQLAHGTALKLFWQVQKAGRDAA